MPTPYVPGAVTVWCRSGESGATEPRPDGDIIPPNRAELVRLCGSGGHWYPSAVEVTIVEPDAMHKDCKLAGHGDLGAAHADPRC
jgi:hypothetical protein